jgi:hypothetical protein
MTTWSLIGFPCYSSLITYIIIYLKIFNLCLFLTLNVIAIRFILKKIIELIK